MRKRVLEIVVVVGLLLSLSSSLSISLAQDYGASYQLLDRQGQNPSYTLNVVVPQTLLSYYQEKSHRLAGLTDFATFVTPYALKPVADSLRQIYSDDEDFVNGALMIVHQMNYTVTQLGKYPAETFVDNQGDCDVFSAVAASIIKAGGLDVVLLDYEEQTHMNIGIHLSSSPEKAREEVYKITYDNIDYYIAETTGGNWTHGWRVGECPDNVKQANAQVITLENAEEIAPGQVSASFMELENSEISLDVWPPIAVEEGTVAFRGSLTPAKQGENVTIYLGLSGSPWTVLGTAKTKADGSYEYVWKTYSVGIYVVRTSWAGDDVFAGSTSEAMSATVLPMFLLVLLVIAAIAIILGLIAVVVSRKSRQESLATKEAEPATFS